MAYTDDGVKAKLSALNETQESIVTVAQWVMFHRCGQCTSLSATLHHLIVILQETRRSNRTNLAYKIERLRLEQATESDLPGQ